MRGAAQGCGYTPFLPALLAAGVEGKVDDHQHVQDSQSPAIQDLQSGQDTLLPMIQYPPSSLPPVIITGNTLTEGSSINVMVVAREQGIREDPRPPQVSCAH